MKYLFQQLLLLFFSALSINLFGNGYASHELNAVECDTQIILTVCDQNILWEKNYGGSDSDGITDFAQTDDGGYILLGTTYSNDFDIADADSTTNTRGYWVIKLDQDGNILWENRFIREHFHLSVSIEQTNTGGYIIAYTVNEYSNGLYSKLIKLDANGLEEWEKVFQYGYRNQIQSLKETADGGFIFASNQSGSYTNFEGNTIGSNSNNVLVVKTDSQGNVEWDAHYNTEYVTTSDIYQTDDNGYLFTGQIAYYDPTYSTDFIVVKYDENGVFQWDQTYGGSKNDNLRISQQANDGGFILAGYSASNDGDVSENTGYDYWMVKIDDQGNIEWEKSHEEINSNIQSIHQTTDNGFIFAGTGSFFNSPENGSDFLVFKIDAFGNIEWQGYLGGTELDFAKKVLETAENEYVVGGFSYSSDGGVVANYGNADIWLAKFTTECLETSNITGQLCNDNDTCTINDIYITDCDCQGTFDDYDGDGICNNEDSCFYLNNDLIGTPCNDYDQCTQNDVYTTDCGCRGTLFDTDNDGVCDFYDNCPGFDNISIGTPCDDGDVCTINDAYDENCICVGVPAEDYKYLDKRWSYDYGSHGFYSHLDIMEKTEDGGFIIVEYDRYGTFGVLKIDSSGNLLWEKRIGITYYIPKSILQTPDGGYVVVGEKRGSNSDNIIVETYGNDDAFVAKLDANGEVEWAKGYGGSDDDAFTSVLNAPDGGYYIGGQSSSNDLGLGDINRVDAWVLKLDSSGNVEWQKLYGGHPYSYLVDLKYALDGNLVFGGIKDRPNTTYGSYWLAKIDTQGEIIWENEFGGSLGDVLFTMEVTSDGGYILGGSSYSKDGDISNPISTIGALDMWVVKTDALGDLEWERSYGTPRSNELIGLKETPEGNFIIAGNVDANDNSSSFDSQLVIKIGVFGNVLFRDYIEIVPNGHLEIADLQVTGEDEIVLLRYIRDFDTNYNKWEISKVGLATLDEIIGMPCDDGDPCTIEDIYVDFCECVGTWIGEDLDGDGICDGKDQCPEFDDASIGDPCDDGDPCTLNDVISDDCLCAGLYTDSDDDGLCNTDDPCPFVDQNLIGMPCVDGDPCTKNEVYTEDCECVGVEVFTDDDGDGIRNCEDICPDFDNELIGTPCDDGFDFTCGDIYRSNCECSGYPCYYYYDDYEFEEDVDADLVNGGPLGASADCMGIANGPNQIDACGVCDSDPTNNNEICSDCNGVTDGNAQIDECGNCLLPDDPNFNICLECKASEVTEVAICDYANGTFSVIFTLDQTADNISFQITNNLTNEVVAVTDENYYTIENFINGAGYSFTIAETLNPECNITFDRSALDCTTTNIELINFEGKALEIGNKLFWTTATEKSSSYFTLERSNNGTDFKVIDKIKSLGNSNTANSYQYLDKSVLKGNYYYRLLETDIAGKTDIASDVILLKRNGQSEIVYTAPVPATEFVNVTFIMEQETLVNYEVYNVTGKIIEAKIYEATEGVNTLNINLQNYASGMYFIKIIDQENSALVTRFVKED